MSITSTMSLITKHSALAILTTLLFQPGCSLQARTNFRFGSGLSVQTYRPTGTATQQSSSGSATTPARPGAPPVQVATGAPAMGNWSKGPILPIARSYPAAAAIGRFIYVTGGLVGSAGPTARMDVLDTQTGKWFEGPAAPTPRYSHGAASLNGMLYVLGGHGSGSTNRLSTVERFDPVKNQWSSVAPMASIHHEPAVATVAGKLCVFGGEAQPGYLNLVECLDPGTNKWTMQPAMPHVRKGGVAATVGEQVYLFGGIQENGQLVASVDIYDARNGRWSTSSVSMPSPRWMATANAFGSSIVIAGGATGGGTTYVRDVAVFDVTTQRWSTIATLPNDRGNAASATMGGLLYLLGGCRSGCNEKIADVDVLKVGP